MAGNLPVKATGWGDRRGHFPTPWDPFMVEIDMLYWVDPRACEGRSRPTVSELARDYGWSRGRLRKHLEKRSQMGARAEPPQSQMGARVEPDEPPSEGDDRDTRARAEPPQSQGGARAEPDGGQAPQSTRARPSPSPSPSPSLEKHMSTFGRLLPIWKRVRSRQGVGWREPDPKGKPNSEGGSLWRLVKAYKADEVESVLTYLAEANDEAYGGANFYIEKKLKLCNVRANFDKLLTCAQDHAEVKPRGYHPPEDDDDRPTEEEIERAMATFNVSPADA